MKPLSGTYILVSNETKWLRKGFNPKTPVLSAHLYCIGTKYFALLFTRMVKCFCSKSSLTQYIADCHTRFYNHVTEVDSIKP